MKEKICITPNPCVGSTICPVFPRMNSPCIFLLWSLVVSSIIVVSADDTSFAPASSVAAYRSQTDGTSSLLPRRLEIGDFASVNEVFSDATISISDVSFSPTVARFTLDLDLTDGECKNVTIGDVAIEWSVRNNQEIVATVDLLDLDIICSLNYEYDYILGVNGRGVVDVFTRNNTAKAVLVFGSQDFGRLPPDQFAVENCTPDINVFDLDFDGEGRLSVGSFVLNAIEKQLRETVANQIQSFLCEFFQEADDEIAESLTRVSNLLDPYLTPLEEVDPLALEQALEVPSNINLLDYQEPIGTIASVIDIFIEEFASFIRKEVSDGNGGRDLNINVLLRQFALDSGGGLKVDLSSIGGLGDGYLFEGSNLLGDISIRIVSVEVMGLDSFSSFEDLADLGRQTLQTTFAIDSLSVVIGAEVEVRPPGGSGDKRLLETAFLEISLDAVEVSTSILLAVDQDKLGALRLGSLLNTDDIRACLFSSLYDIQISTLAVNSVAVRELGLTGLDSPGLQRVLSTGLDLFYAMFEASILEALPGFLQIYIVDLLNDALFQVWKTSFCFAPTLGSEESDSFMDVRELLLPAEIALEYGASGTEPYDRLASFAKGFIDDELEAVDSSGTPTINDALIARFTEKQSGTRGTLIFEDELVELDSIVSVGGFDGRIEFRLSNVRLENLDTLGQPISIFDPVRGESRVLKNTATLGATSSDRPFRIFGTLFVAVTADETQIRNEMDVGIDLQSTNVLVTLFVKMLKDNFFSFPIEDVFELDCWLSTMPPPTLDIYGIRAEGTEPTLALRELAIAVDDMNFTFSCIDCSSSKLNEISALLASPVGREDARESANNMLDYFLSLTEGDDSFGQTQMDRYLVEAPKRCRHRPEYDANATESTKQYKAFKSDPASEDSITFFLAMIATAGIIILVSFVIVIVVRWIVTRRQRKWLAALPDEQVLVIYKEQQQEDAIEEEKNGLTQAMYQSPELPALVRYLVPVILLANIGLFLSGHLSLGGSVRIYLQLAGEEVVVDDFYSFSIAQSAVELYNAGAKELAILMLLFSGVWPYSKQIITLVLWFLPPTTVSVERRGKIFLWLDLLAKWSMVDVFVMIISIVAFRVTIKSPDKSFLPEDLYRVDMLVVPLWGLYANMIAQLLSQVTSHAIIYYHRRVVKAAAREYDMQNPLFEVPPKEVSEDEEEIVMEASANGKGLEEPTPSLTPIPPRMPPPIPPPISASTPAAPAPAPAAATRSTPVANASDEPECLFHHAFVRPHRVQCDQLRLRPGVNPVVIGVCIGLAALVLAGCIANSISFEFLGIVGLAVESGQDFDEARSDYSIISIANLLMDEARFLGTAKDKIGMASISSLLVLSTLLVPLFQAFFLLVQWFYPLIQESRGKISTTVEILQAWQYMEVYLVAVIVGAWQIGGVSEFLVNTYCEDLQDTFSELVFYGLISSEDAQCFKVEASVEAAAYILIPASVCLDLLNVFVTKAVGQYTRDKQNETREEQEPLIDTTMDKEVIVDPRSRIHPMPVLFTDRFRWLLRSEQSSS